MTPIQFNLVSGTSPKKGGAIIISMMVVNLISIIVGAFILKTTWIPIVTTALFFIVLFAMKKRQRAYKIIGTIKLDNNGVELNNPEQGAHRTISIFSIGSVKIRNGVAASEQDVMEYLTMYMDITLKTGEIVSVHIGVDKTEGYTINTISEYFMLNKIDTTTPY